jgi:DNA-damage-inducible protein D
MKKETISKLTIDFENFSHKQGETEYWLAREIMPLLGYDKWDNFANVIEKAIVACNNAGQKEADHFLGVTKMVCKQKSVGLNC